MQGTDPDESPIAEPIATEMARDERYRWTKAQLIALIAITVLAAVIRIVNLSDPKGVYVFDEVYYAKDACLYAGDAPKVCGSIDDRPITEESTYVHPPLGKAIIAIGVTAFGFDSFGWRIMPLVFGTLSVALMFLIARKLFRSLFAACAASLLLAFDFLHFVQSRVAMLDVFVMFFCLLAFYFVVLDREDLMRRVDSFGNSTRRGFRPWRVAAGIAAGAAVACKWSGIFMLLGLVVLSFVWEVHARREGTDDRDVLPRTLGREAFSIVLCLMVLPFLVYVAAYVGRPELGSDYLSLPWSPGSWWRNVLERQQYMWTTHKNLSQMHSYESPSWSWLLLKRPVSYFFCAGADCDPKVGGSDYQEIMAFGSPFVWWTSLMALVPVTIAWFRNRDWRGPEGAILAGFAFTYGFWLIPQVSSRPAIFLFYLLPTIPFMCLALTYVAMRLGKSWEARAAVALYAAIALGLFVFYYPLMAKTTLSQPEWKKRIWVFDNCDKPRGEVVQVTSTETKNGKEKVTTSSSTEEYAGSPTGWCWI